MSTDFDKAIDRVAREMLDAEPPDGLRERVLQRIETPRRGLRLMWIAVPVAAAAAVLVLAVLLPRPVQVETPRSGSDYRLSADASAATRPALEMPGPDTQHAAPATHAPVVHDETGSDNGFSVPPLAGPPPIALQTIASGTTTPMNDIGVAPLSVPALEVNALPDAPQERREE